MLSIQRRAGCVRRAKSALYRGVGTFARRWYTKIVAPHSTGYAMNTRLWQAGELLADSPTVKFLQEVAMKLKV